MWHKEARLIMSSVGYWLMAAQVGIRGKRETGVIVVCS